MGCALRARRHRSPRAGARAAGGGAGGQRAAEHASRADRGRARPSNGRRDRRRLLDADDRRRTSSSQTPTRRWSTARCFRGARGPLTDASLGAPVDGTVRRLLRHVDATTRGRRITPSCSAHATAVCSTTSSGGRVLAEDHSLYVHAPTRSDPSMAPAGHDAFYVLSPVPNLRGATRLGGRSRALLRSPARDDGAAPPARAARKAGHLPHDDAGGLRVDAAQRGRRSVRTGAHARPVGLLPLPQPIEHRRDCTSSAPARIRAPACRACCRRRSSSTASCLPPSAARLTEW